MKKLLLSLWVLILGIGVANAASVTHTVDGTEKFPLTIGDATLTVSGGNSIQSDHIRFHANSVLTFAAQNGAKITAINLTISDGSKKGNFSASGTTGLTITQSTGANVAATVVCTSPLETVKITTSSQARVQTIEIVFEDNGLQDAGLSFPKDEYSITLGEAFTQPTLSKTTDAPASYVSSKPEVAEVDENTGAVTVKAGGTTEITASVKATTTYKAGSASYKLTVIDPNAPVWKKLTDVSQLGAGSEIVITNVPSALGGYAMSTTSNTNNRRTTDAEFSEDLTELTLTDEMLILEVGLLSDGKYTLKTTNYKSTNGYLTAGATGKNNYCKVSTDGDTTGWTISINDKGQAEVKYAATSGNNVLQYNTSGLFGCYGSASQSPIAIFINSKTIADSDAVAKPTISFDESTKSVSMSCTTEGAEIHYTLDGTEPTATSTLYENSFVINKTTTIKAVAVKDGKLSPVNTFEAVVLAPLTGFGELKDEHKDKTVEFGCEMTAVWQSADKSNLYVRDANGKYMLIFGEQSNTYNNGDTFNTLKGTYYIYNGLPEIKDAVIGETTPGTAVEPEVGSAEVITDANLNAYYVFDNVTVSAFNNLNAKMTLADNSTITLRDNFKLFTSGFTAGSNYKVIGFVAKYVKGSTNTMQFFPISIEKSETALQVIEPKLFYRHNRTNGEMYVTYEFKLKNHNTEVIEVEVTVNGHEDIIFAEVEPENTMMRAAAETETFKGALKATNGVVLTDDNVASPTINFAVKADGAQIHTIQGHAAVPTGVDGIATDNTEAIYFNLQGVRVATPRAGETYIRVANGKSDKVLY